MSGLISNEAKRNKAALAESGGSALSGHIASVPGAVATDLQKVLRQKYHAFDAMTSAEIADVLTGAFTLDVTAKLQAVEDHVGGLVSGGTIEYPAGLYKAAGLVKRYRVSWEGSGGTCLNETSSEFAAATLKAPEGNTVPIWRNDETAGYVRSNGLDGLSQRYVMAHVKNMRFDANAPANNDSRGLAAALTRAWSFGIERCQFKSNASGYGVRILDCNALNVVGNSSIGGWFVESLADSHFGGGNQFGGASSVGQRFWPTLWLSGLDFHKNAWGQNFVFNNTGNIGAKSYTFTYVTDTLTTNEAHLYQDLDPVIVSPTGGTLPPELIEGRCYYVKAVGPTTLKLASSRANFNAGTFIALSGGSGTWHIQQGKSTNLYIEGPQRNSFAGFRSDQAYGCNIWLDRASNNTFPGLLAQEAGIFAGGATDPGPQAAVRLTNTSVGNCFPGAILDGSVAGQQTIGYKADASSAENNWSGESATVRGHATALEINGVSVPLILPLLVGSDRFEVTAGTPVIGSIASARRNAWMFDSASKETIGTELVLPSGWAKIRITVQWTNAGAGAGDVAWGANIGFFGDGDNLNVTDASSTNSVIATAPVQDVQKNTVLTPDMATTPGKTFYLRIFRDAAISGDTLANDAGLISVTIEKVVS